MDVALLCKCFFSFGIAVSISGTLIPSLRQRIMNYGSRATVTAPRSKDAVILPKSKLTQVLDWIAYPQVPHTWFTHYYMVSVLLSIFWAFQITTHGKAFNFLASYHQPSSAEGMTVNQVLLVWIFMIFQGARRFYESIRLAPSQSKMWSGMWLLGMVYYIVVGISIWIEGTPALSAAEVPTKLLVFSKPSMKTFVAVPIFILASGIQHDCHEYLASLKKYTFPDQYLFRWVLCPHYTSECFIYLAIAIVAAPDGQILNKTLLSTLGFVISNLAVTADSTKVWYADKFGEEKLRGRWRMLPYVY